MKQRIESAIWNQGSRKHTLEQQNGGKKEFLTKDSVRDLRDNSKHSDIVILEVPEEEKDKRIKNLSEEIMTENFPNLLKEIDIQIQEVYSLKPNESKDAHNKTHHN